MIDELDEIQIIIESEDSDNDDCKITESSTLISKREILYNLKKEITIKGVMMKKDDNEKKTAWRTLIVKS